MLSSPDGNSKISYENKISGSESYRMESKKHKQNMYKCSGISCVPRSKTEQTKNPLPPPLTALPSPTTHMHFPFHDFNLHDSLNLWLCQHFLKQHNILEKFLKPAPFAVTVSLLVSTLISSRALIPEWRLVFRIRIWIRIDLAVQDPDPYWECGSGSRGMEIYQN